MKHYSAYRNTREGTVLMIGNGPSLSDVPKEFLEMYPSFGVNEIHHEKSSLRNFWPTHYVMVGLNQHRYPDQRKPVHELVKNSKLSFINRIMAHHYPYDNVVGVLSSPAAEDRAERLVWSSDPLCWVGLGFTVTYVCFQIALYLGYREVLCVGLDNRFDGETKHFYGDRKDLLMVYEPATLAHGIDYVFAIAKKEYKKAGAKIINLTENTNSKSLPQEGTVAEYMRRKNVES